MADIIIDKTEEAIVMVEDCKNIIIPPPSLFKRFVKRTFDFLSSGLGIIFLLPFFILFTPLVAIKMKGNPFFVQKRPGKNGKSFRMIKYRTMTNKKDADGNLLPDSDRLTKFGKIMRKLSIDELPELFNIFTGKMSVVGPRPLLVSYLPLYNEYQAQRHLVRPGLTGLAQISGRNAISWDQKFDKDIEYISTISFAKDIKIIFGTVGKVLGSKDISQEGEATMEFFTGNVIDMSSEIATNHEVEIVANQTDDNFEDKISEFAVGSLVNDDLLQVTESVEDMANNKN